MLDKNHEEIDGWIILELETGYADGVYGTRKMAESVIEVWDRRRPIYTHNVLGVNKAEMLKHSSSLIPDSKFLPRQKYDETKAMKGVTVH